MLRVLSLIRRGLVAVCKHLLSYQTEIESEGIHRTPPDIFVFV